MARVPGPWSIEHAPRTPADAFRPALAERWTILEDGMALCAVQDERRARLMAAAPALCEALAAAIDALHDAAKHLGNDEAEAAFEAASHANEALRKARGEA